MIRLKQLQGTLIVSCQAEDGFPLNSPDHLAAIAATAVLGGASGIRASDPANIRAIRQAVAVPVIGIYKKDYPGFEVRITPTIAEVEAIIAAGSDIIALDATARPRPDGQSFGQLVQTIRERFTIPIMADISTFEEGIVAAELGVDLIATTLSGYSEYSKQQTGPDIELIHALATASEVPVIAEGRIRNADEVRAALEAGALAVVVGSMITRPHLITESFVAGTRPRPNPDPVLALDIGGTKMAAGMVSSSGQLLVKEQVPTPTDLGGPAIISQAVALLESVLAKGAPYSPAAVGISTGGQVNENGEIVGGTEMIPGWVGAPLKETIAGTFQLPTAVLNDGHAAALAESHFGAGRTLKSMLCIVIGTGLGGGLAAGGQIQPGAHGLAGSIGQLKVSPDCQSWVPLELLVSGPGLLRIYHDLAANHEVVDTGRMVAERAKAGDKLAREAVDKMGWWLGLGLSHALHVYDASCVVVGGSVAQIGDLLLDSARLTLQKFGHASVANTPILAAELGPEAQLVGAAVFAWQNQGLHH